MKVVVECRSGHRAEFPAEPVWRMKRKLTAWGERHNDCPDSELEILLDEEEEHIRGEHGQ